METQKKIRVLIAKAGLDGHDRGAKVVAAALRDAGMEVIYSGLRKSPEMIVEAALQEDVHQRDRERVSVQELVKDAAQLRRIAGDQLEGHDERAPAVRVTGRPEEEDAGLNWPGRMEIAWKRSLPLAAFLPRHHPASGLLAGAEGLRDEGNFAFSLLPETLPVPRRIAPQVLAALEERHRALGSPPEVFASLRLLADGAAAVVTGQQAGLLGGPLFTLCKTLTAIRAARALTARHGRPFVPVF